MKRKPIELNDFDFAYATEERVNKFLEKYPFLKSDFERISKYFLGHYIFVYENKCSSGFNYILERIVDIENGESKIEQEFLDLFEFEYIPMYLKNS